MINNIEQRKVNILKKAAIICFVAIFLVSILNIFPIGRFNGYSAVDQTINDVIFANAEEETGSSSAPTSEKGGAYYLGAGAKLEITDGASIIGTGNVYGGAVYVGNGAEFTMSGGTIYGCSARYGGAVYVASGGAFNMTGGSISCCLAVCAPAIYVEEGATVFIDGLIETNHFGVYYSKPSEMVSEDTIKVGQLTSGLDMHYLDYGYYPQTYVGDSLNADLENWFSSTAPSSVNTYTVMSNNWQAYLYTDGLLYARGESSLYSSSLTYKNGTSVYATGTTVWFKVEPVRWVILNYTDYINGTATTLDCVSEMALVSNIMYNSSTTVDNANRWNVSNIRTWLNTACYEQMFGSFEKNYINLKSITTTLTSGESVVTQDYLYLLERTYVNSSSFSAAKACAPTDFALSNYSNSSINASYPTRNRSDGMVCIWWLNTLSGTGSVYVVYGTGFCSTNSVIQKGYSVRPAISFAI